MKIILSILFCLFINLVSQAQTRPKYHIKVVEKNKHSIGGIFYAITDHKLILLKHGTDTIKLWFANVKDLYIRKRGVILPFMVLGTGIALVAATKAKLPLDQFVYLFAGAPIAAIVGNLVGQLLANKRFYRGLEISDFPKIKADLEKYTQIIINP